MVFLNHRIYIQNKTVIRLMISVQYLVYYLQMIASVERLLNESRFTHGQLKQTFNSMLRNMLLIVSYYMFSKKNLENKIKEYFKKNLIFLIETKIYDNSLKIKIDKIKKNF
ncbi:hypothetical protein BpHYR1_054088 [Brachionus plicatilis]|uniref:Uncharacterized protein n=1 Tax=Brachionus plicatilis TaxID=10195 RepID=A0A3M7RXZ2_BRAPC|nr:hypothetical protein BpHYR1_054088 [Brachionus plicatilis]